MSIDAKIATALEARRIRFYHAENLQNLTTYARRRAVICRDELMAADEAYTRFYSDDQDRRLGALSRVFGNITDFGEVFARGTGTIPNIYGPITCVFRPSVFGVMTDIVITKRSIATEGATWRLAGLKSDEELAELTSGDAYGSPVHSAWQWAELSCANHSLQFDQLERVIVEPITIAGQPFIDIVRPILTANGVASPIHVRSPFRNTDALNALVTFCEGLSPDPAKRHGELVEAALPGEAQIRPQLRPRALLWCRYFFEGTIEPLRQRK